MKKTYNYNYEAYKDTGKPIRKYNTCNYWEVPAHPTCMELLQYLIIGQSKIVAERLEQYNSRQRWRARMEVTARRNKRAKKLAEKLAK